MDLGTKDGVRRRVISPLKTQRPNAQRAKELDMRYVLTASLLVLIFTANPALSGERIEFYSKHINVSTSSETVEVGDEPGHILAFFSAKGVGTRLEGPEEPPYKIEIQGTGDYRADGSGKDQGYGKFIFADGSYYFERWSGKVKDGRAVGTATYYGGSGRFAGMEGSSKYDCGLMGDRFICDVHGVIELP